MHIVNFLYSTYLFYFIGPENGFPSAIYANAVLVDLLVVIKSTKAFPFHNRSSQNFAYR